jgi:predicted TIM-barrel fold metal-dependent hydrolase
MIIDFHVHYHPTGDPRSNRTILDEMDKYGIEKSLILATPDHPRYVQLGMTGFNERVFSFVSEHPDRLVMAAYIEPRNVMEAQTQIQNYYDRGVRFFKMWPGHGYAPDDPMIYPVWEKLNDLKATVIFHTGMLGVRPQLGQKINRMAGLNAKYGQPVLFDHPARLFTDMNFVLAHTAYPWSLEAIEMCFMFPNIYLDFSCGLGYEAYNLINRLRPGRLAWDRFIFGTDTAGAPDAAGRYVTRWTEMMKDPFFAPHAEDFFYNNAQKLLNRAGF